MIRIIVALMFVLGLSPSVLAEDARYRLEIEISWSAETHPHDWPAGSAHMSGVVGATHRSPYLMFADGHTATSGLKSVAERGRSRILQAELEEAIDRRRIKSSFRANGIASPPGRTVVEFSISESHPQVSFVTMIAPSPDWFTGLSAVDLRDDAGWRDEARYTLWAWDAGTDRGASYASANEPNQPTQSIRLLATPHFLDDAGLKPVGTATFTRID